MEKISGFFLFVLAWRWHWWVSGMNILYCYFRYSRILFIILKQPIGQWYLRENLCEEKWNVISISGSWCLMVMFGQEMWEIAHLDDFILLHCCCCAWGKLPTFQLGRDAPRRSHSLPALLLDRSALLGIETKKKKKEPYCGMKNIPKLKVS